MNKGLFCGWREVFSFTFKQAINAKNFKAVTIGLTIVFLLGGFAISALMAFFQKKDATEVSPIETVHVIDESGLELLYWDGFLQNNQRTYPDINFVIENDTVEAVNAAILAQIPENASSEEPIAGQEDVILRISEEGDGYLMSLYIPEGSRISDDEGEDFLEDVMMVMEQSKLFSSGISMEKLKIAMSNISTSMLDAGEAEKSVGEEVVAMLFPMLSMLFIYMMNLVYGQSMGNIVSVEKTSKLMEMMLTMTRPYGLIFGKIFAMTSIAIFQMVLWIGGLVVGFVSGDMVARSAIYPAYNNVLMEVFKLLSSQEGSSAFSIGAVVLAFVTVCLAFLFYCVLAGMIASFASKAENLAQVMGYYQLIMMFSFFGAYLVPMEGSEAMKTFCRIFPLTSAYLLPGDLVVGNVPLVQGILCMLVLLVTTVVLVVVAGKVYKNQLFYKGTKLTNRFMKKKNKDVSA